MSEGASAWTYFTRRALQVWQPFLDFLWPTLGARKLVLRASFEIVPVGDIFLSAISRLQRVGVPRLQVRSEHALGQRSNRPDVSYCHSLGWQSFATMHGLLFGGLLMNRVLFLAVRSL